MKKFILAIALVSISQYAFGQTVEGSWPAEGGAITVSVSGGDIQAGGFDFKSPTNKLTGGESAAPFDFYIAGADAENVGQVTVGSLGKTVMMADGSETTFDISVAAGAVDSDVTATWGKGLDPVSFPVRPIPEPATGLMAAFAAAAALGLRRRR